MTVFGAMDTFSKVTAERVALPFSATQFAVPLAARFPFVVAAQTVRPMLLRAGIPCAPKHIAKTGRRGMPLRCTQGRFAISAVFLVGCVKLAVITQPVMMQVAYPVPVVCGLHSCPAQRRFIVAALFGQVVVFKVLVAIEMIEQGKQVLNRGLDLLPHRGRQLDNADKAILFAKMVAHRVAPVCQLC
ncbi:hypothetical protein [Shinella sp. BYT-45]|uniref:hypothetical protein n=1 Tax=Shinella sp. BYT-45 TaxID=3377377 RepID=UPI00397FA738